MNEFTKRIIFGVIYVLLVILATTTNNYFFTSIFLIFLLFCTYEFNKLVKIKSVFPYLLNALPFIYFSFSFNLSYKIFYLLLLLLPFIINLYSKNNNGIKTLGSIFLSLIYIGLPFILLPNIASENEFKLPIILCTFILLWTNDTFAYLIGRQFGKRKLFEQISPKKTIEGFIGGLIFTLFAGFIISNINTNLPTIYWLILAVIVSVIGTIGDLIESKFKRETGVKDSSNLIPGHGGFLDRLDSFIFATPFVFIYFSIILQYVS